MFESKLLNLEKQGRLVRFLTNNRLRRQLDRLNSTLCLQLTELENDFLKESSSSLVKKKNYKIEIFFKIQIFFLDQFVQTHL